MAEVCYPPGLLSVDEAVANLLRRARQKSPETETLPLSAALGRVLAQAVLAHRHVPPEANSAMDGIACRHAELQAGVFLPLSQRIAAGDVPEPLPPGSAARIFTGAILPLGADTVVMQEHCEFRDDSVSVSKLPNAGANIRPAGQDLAQGTEVLPAGTRLGPVAISLLASLGLATVEVYLPVRVAVLSTGDELLEPGEAWSSGKIYNSNRPLLTGLLQGWGVELIDLGRVADSPAATRAAFARAREAGAQVLISSGGVSVGEEDHVKAALQAEGELDFWKIAIKPGKPVAVGRIGDMDFLGLPGNPQSVFVSALIFARPFLLARQGQSAVLPESLPLPCAFTVRKPGDRREYVRVQWQPEQGGLVAHPQPSSGALFSAFWADGFAVVEPGTAPQPGQLLAFLPLSSLLLP